MDINLGIKKNTSILALGPESAGNFCFYKSGRVYFSKDFGDLLEEKNFQKFKNSVLRFLKKDKLKPTVILTDLHPLYKTTIWGEEITKRCRAKHIKVQHHIAHIFSAIGEKMIENRKLKIENCIGIACDGTGYGLDEKIWGGEIFKININCFERVGYLENQIMIGGDLAVKEPARMLISILSKFLPKEKIYQLVKKYYSKNQFELLSNQLRQNFNCQQTSSAGRILDAVSVILGFAKNQRNYKHEPIELLEKNSTKPYLNLKPVIKKFQIQNSKHCELLTTPLFEYLIKNLHRDKKRLAATAQLYIAQGIYEIIRKNHDFKFIIPNSFFAGGLANNKIISSYLESKGVFTNKKFPRGDAGISFGQIIYYFYNSLN